MGTLNLSHLLTTYLRANQIIISFFTIIIFFIHLDNKCRAYHDAGEPYWCTPIEDVQSCIGHNLVWSEKSRGVYDWNFKWRADVFTLKPDALVDLWTPFVLGVIGMLAYFGKPIEIFQTTWLNVLGFYLFVALYGQFGYAGNFGVFWGFWTTCGFLPFVIIGFFMIPSAATYWDLSTMGVSWGSQDPLDEDPQQALNAEEPILYSFNGNKDTGDNLGERGD